MNTRRSLVAISISFGFVCLIPVTGLAAKTATTVTPESLQAHGFSLHTERSEDGTVALTLSRDLTKAQSFPSDSGLMVSRHVVLNVSSPNGFQARCSVAPESRNPRGTLAYRFVLSRECLAHSRLTFAEDHDYQDQTREHLIGGGAHYEFELGQFIQSPSRKTP